MSPVVKVNIVLLLTALSITGCASAPVPEPEKYDPYNTADSQRTRAKQTQDELSGDTAK